MKLSSAFALCAFLAITAANAFAEGVSRLTATKNNVQFEIEQKELLLKRSLRLTESLKTLRRARVDDQHILKALEIKDTCLALQETIRTATARQAVIMEEITATLQQHLSAQENTEYRNCNLVLMELANAQGKENEKLTRDIAALNAYLKAIPPPEELTLPFGLTLKLVRDAAKSTDFYVSMPLTNSIAIKYMPALQLDKTGALDEPASLNFYQAKTLVENIARTENVRLAMPSNATLEILSQADCHPAIAVWSAEPFSSKNSLARNRKTLAGMDCELEKLRLTPAQSYAAARFKITFRTVWDPDHRLGNIPFTRELPQAAYPQLGAIVVANARIGTEERMNALTQQYHQMKTKEAR